MKFMLFAVLRGPFFCGARSADGVNMSTSSSNEGVEKSRVAGVAAAAMSRSGVYGLLFGTKTTVGGTLGVALLASPDDEPRSGGRRASHGAV